MKTAVRLHHAAYMTWNMDETIDFYTNVLKLKLVQHFEADRVPSTGDPFPYFHAFFEMGDGSVIAFFEVPNIQKPPQRPAIDTIFNHLALSVETLDELEEAKAELLKRGHDVVGITDHDAFRSIYFFDPNGLRLELACQVRALTPEDADNARDAAASWSKRRAGLYEAALQPA